MNKLRTYLRDELHVPQAKDETVDTEYLAIEVLKAMTNAYAVVQDALNVATGHAEKVQGQPPKKKGFTVNDRRIGK